MALSPSYTARILQFPPQPRPPAHWPEDCAEVMAHDWMRVFRCPLPRCGKTHMFRRDEMREDSGLACYGDGTSEIFAEPSE